MLQLLLGNELTDDELRESCGFDEDDISIANQTQIDFILICEPDTEHIPNAITRNMYRGLTWGGTDDGLTAETRIPFTV